MMSENDGQGHSLKIFQGAKIEIFALEWIVLAYDNWLHYIFEVPGQNGPLRTKKRPFWAQIGYAKKWIFLKNIIFKLVKIARKVVFWVNNDVRK